MDAHTFDAALRIIASAKSRRQALRLLTVGEVGMSWLPNLPDAATDVRYGRAFTFGTAWHQAYTSPALSTRDGCNAANSAGRAAAGCAGSGKSPQRCAMRLPRQARQAVWPGTTRGPMQTVW